MQIGEFAARAGTTPRALRHYEDQGLLTPERTPAGFRTYQESDLVTVERIRIMLNAGLSTATIATYLNCVRTGENGTALDMCSGLRAELDAVARRLDDHQARITRTRNALCALDASQPS